VVLRLITDREQEIEKFRTREYWSIEADCKSSQNKAFKAKLSYLDGKKLDKFDLNNEDLARNAVKQIEGSKFFVSNVEKKRVNRHPHSPFITSTLQQEASRKLGFSATRTMQTAQKLYEGIDIGGETTGLITYMRTDSPQISDDALAQIRKTIPALFGKEYLPDSPRVYKTKSKNAQEIKMPDMSYLMNLLSQMQQGKNIDLNNEFSKMGLDVDAINQQVEAALNPQK
jgi:DNA topoisomerase-1